MEVPFMYQSTKIATKYFTPLKALLYAKSSILRHDL